MAAPAVAMGDVAARRIPWFEPHHCNELFHALPPPSTNASAIEDAKSARDIFAKHIVAPL